MILARWRPRSRAKMTLADLAGQVWLAPAGHVSARLDELRDMVARASVADLRSASMAQPAGDPLYEVSDGVATLGIQGDLLPEVPWLYEMLGISATSTNTLRALIDAALNDPEVRAIALAIDSPGGTATGIAGLADAIHAAEKPIYAYGSGQVDSAAYWIASQADTLSIEQDTEIGSIGVFAVVEDSSAAALAAGIKVHVLRSGEHKGVGVDGVPVTDSHLAALQRNVDDIAALFRAAVARGRGLTAENVSTLATGEVWYGAASIDLGLADTIADSSAARAAIQEQTNMDITEQLAAMAARIDTMEAAQAGLRTELAASQSAQATAEALATEAATALAASVEAGKRRIIASGVAAGKITGDLVAAVESMLGAMDPPALEAFVSALPVQTHATPSSGATPAPSDNPVAQIAAEAAKLRAADPTLSPEKAQALAWRNNPDAYKAYARANAQRS